MLKEWLPFIMQSLEPWVSSSDIDAGSRWSAEVGKELEATDFGILCLTQENLDAPWILFEAGTLAKSLDNSHLCPLLIDLRPSDLKGPLAQFQSLEFNKAGIWKLISTIYQSSNQKHINENQLSKIFERFWPDLEKNFLTIEFNADIEKVERSERSILEELLNDMRIVKREILQPERAVFLPSSSTNPIFKPNSITLTVDTSLILPKNSVRQRVYILDESDFLQDFLDSVWTDVVSQRFDAYTYGEQWILVNMADNKPLIKQGSRDSRKLGELNLGNRENLQIKVL